ncbi:V-type ATPase [Meira miltonrushii]|uniref:V-type proton ATPase subunit F n=1 Tax=Meira miltonrushii TaxID=1280837 RepID=A0A316VMH2_9BASI|nr:V-type ATPase [Meira miltonrushii]PWN38278.1 V-type ATPase [Meira miltonrushii]
MANVADNRTLIALISDEDTATGLLLAGIGHRNFFIVTSTTNVSEIESAFQTFTQNRGDIAILLITQPLAEKIRQICDRYEQAFPAVLEIPSKDAPYDPSKDSILKRVQKVST